MTFDPAELLALARDHFEQNRVEEALARLKQLMQGGEAPEGTLQLAARVYTRLRLFDRAIALLERCLEIEPESLDLRIELAMVYQDSGDRATALAHWNALLRQHPLMPPALFNAAYLLAQLEKGAEAHRHLDVLLQTAQPDNLYAGRAREFKRMLQARTVPAAPGDPAGRRGTQEAGPGETESRC